YASIAADKRERGIPSPDCHRKIEGGNDPGHAQRMPGLHHAMFGALRRDGESAKLPRKANGEVANVNHLLDLAQALGKDLARLKGDKFTQRRLVGAQLLPEQAYKLAPFWRGHGPPFEKRGVRPLHDAANLAR